MSNSELFLDILKFDEDKLVYIRPRKFTMYENSVGIYYSDPENINPATELPISEKIVIKTPKMITPYGIRMYKSKRSDICYMALSFNSLTNIHNDIEIKQFYEFIRKIDKYNEAVFLENKLKWGLSKKVEYEKILQSDWEDHVYYMTVTIPTTLANEIIPLIFDENNKACPSSIVSNNSIVTVALEMTDLKFDHEYCRTTWNVLQIKKMKPYSRIQEFFMTGCYIDDKDDTSIYSKRLEEKSKRVEIHQEPPAQKQPIQETSRPPAQTGRIPAPPQQMKKPEPIITKMCLLPSELLDAKSTLRKVDTDIDRMKKSKK